MTFTKLEPNQINRRGFTIVELLIVIAVIGILAAITIVAYNGIQNRAKTTAAQSAVAQAGKKIAAYTVQNGDALPSTLAIAGVVDSDSTAYQYTPNTTVNPGRYCVTATTNGVSSHIASGGKPTDGPCVGHTGTSPTTPADGGSCPNYNVVVPGSSLFGTQAFCVMTFEARNSNGTAVSNTTGVPWVNITQTAAISTSAAACDGCHLITEAEWLTIAHNVLSVASNWSGGSVGSGYVHSGHNDGSPAQALNGWANSNPCYGTIIAGEGASCSSTGAQRRTLTLTNGEVIWDFAGNVQEWTSGSTVDTGTQPGLLTDANDGWKQWNNTLLLPGNFSNAFPKYGSPLASAWSSTQGIGQLLSNYNQASSRSFARGGYWSQTTLAGIFTLNMINTAANVSIDRGFRVTR